MLDDEGSDNLAGFYDFGSYTTGKLLGVSGDHAVPGQQISKLDPLVIVIEGELS